MKQVGIFEAKTHLSSLIDEVQQGGEVVITRHGRPVAKITRMQPELTQDEVAQRREALLELRKIARKINIKATPEEIKSWINEGRR